jgi:hypothetical protein
MERLSSLGPSFATECSRAHRIAARVQRQARAVVRELSTTHGANERRDAETARQRIVQSTARGGPTRPCFRECASRATATLAGASSKGRLRASAVRMQPCGTSDNKEEASRGGFKIDTVLRRRG